MVYGFVLVLTKRCIKSGPFFDNVILVLFLAQLAQAVEIRTYLTEWPRYITKPPESEISVLSFGKFGVPLHCRYSLSTVTQSRSTC